MSDHYIFLMGKYEAQVPKDRLYAPNHMWFRAEGDAYRVGFTAFAVRLLQDVYFLDWNVEPGDVVVAKQEIGEVEVRKRFPRFMSPSDGTLVRFNRELMKDPTAINVDNYGAGWLFDFDSKDALLLSAEDYIRRLEGTWDERSARSRANE